MAKRSVTLRKTDRLLGYKLSYGGTPGWTTQFSKMSGIVTVTGTVVNITNNGDSNFNLGDEEFDDLLIAVTKSQVMSPARKKAYARLEFLERKYAARNAEMKLARERRNCCKKAKQTDSDSQVGIGAQLFCPLHASKRLEKVAKSFYEATTQMKPEAEGEFTGRYNTTTSIRQEVLSELFRAAWGGELYLRMEKQIMTDIANKKK